MTSLLTKGTFFCAMIFALKCSALFGIDLALDVDKVRIGDADNNDRRIAIVQCKLK